MFHDDDQAFDGTLEREQPRVVGISVLATVRAAALRLAERAHHSGAIVVVGGADPTGRPESYLHHRPDGEHPVDLVVVGEGEQTLLELLPRLLDEEPWGEALRVIDGLAFLDSDGQVVSTAPRKHCADLDNLALPARDLIDLEAYRQAWCDHHGFFSLSVIATRGCPYG
ncbi:MAG: cobalamin-dependent protein, partial [Anaerolineae bacterium]